MYFKPYIIKTQYLTFVHWLIHFCNITSVTHLHEDANEYDRNMYEAHCVFKTHSYIHMCYQI